VQRGELTQKLNQRTLTKRVIDGSMEGKSRSRLGEMGYPTSSRPSRYKITLVEDKNQLLVRLFLLDEVSTTSTDRITSIKNMNNNIR